MRERKNQVIEVVEVKKDFIEEKINGHQYGYNPDLFNEEMIEAIRECFQGVE